MRIKTNRHPRGIDVGPRKRPLSLPNFAVLNEGETWATLSNRGFEYRAMARRAAARERVEAKRLSRTRQCQRCQRTYVPATVRSTYCTDTCRKAAWKRKTRGNKFH